MEPFSKASKFGPVCLQLCGVAFHGSPAQACRNRRSQVGRSRPPRIKLPAGVAARRYTGAIIRELDDELKIVRGEKYGRLAFTSTVLEELPRSLQDTIFEPPFFHDGNPQKHRKTAEDEELIEHIEEMLCGNLHIHRSPFRVVSVSLSHFFAPRHTTSTCDVGKKRDFFQNYALPSARAVWVLIGA